MKGRMRVVSVAAFVLALRLPIARSASGSDRVDADRLDPRAAAALVEETERLGRLPPGPEARAALPGLKRRIRSTNPDLAKAAAEAWLSIDPMDAEARATFETAAPSPGPERAVVFGTWSIREKKAHFEISRTAAGPWKDLAPGSRLWLASLFGQAAGTLLRRAADASGLLSVDVASDGPVAPEGPVLLSTKPFPPQRWEIASAGPHHAQRAAKLVLAELQRAWTSHTASAAKDPQGPRWMCPWYRPGMKNLPPEVDLELRLVRTTFPRPAEYLLAKVPDCIEGEYVGGGDTLLVKGGAGEPPSILSHFEGFGVRPFLDVDGDGFPELIGLVPVGGTAYRTLFRLLPKASTVTDECVYFRECP